MPATVHAVLGASSASRWLACPGSIREIGALPGYAREQSSVYAKQGTAAHYLSERCLAERSDPKDYHELWISEHGVISSEKSRPDLPGDWFEVDSEMVESLDIYLGEVYSHLERLGNAELMIERTVYPIPGREAEMFGTADVIILEPYGELIVIDLKYGKGVVVETEWNDQAMCYGLGALRAVGGAADVSKVTLIIVQPRAPHADGPIRRWTLPAAELLEFSDELGAGADATRDPNAPLMSGSHCRFCPAAFACEELKSKTFDAMIVHVPDDLTEIEEPEAHVRLPDPRDPIDLGRAKAIADLAEFWVKEVNVMVQRALEHGITVPGFKLVRKTSKRKWKDETDLERRLANKAGLGVDEIYTKKLKSPAQLEKNPKLGRKWVARYCVKPEGGLTVAPDNDPREPVPSLPESVPPIDDASDTPAAVGANDQKES